MRKFHDTQANEAINLIDNQENAKLYIERWLETAKDTYYKDLLMRILKAVYVHVHCKEPSQSLYKGSFETINKELIQKPPRIDKLSHRKMAIPSEEDRYIKFPELRKASLNQNLEGYRQVSLTN